MFKMIRLMARLVSIHKMERELEISERTAYRYMVIMYELGFRFQKVGHKYRIVGMPEEIKLILQSVEEVKLTYDSEYFVPPSKRKNSHDTEAA